MDAGADPASGRVVPATTQEGWLLDHVLVTDTGAARLPTKTPGPVTLSDREGVFVHSYKCWECDLEFALFSWRRDRHHVGAVGCPECVRPTAMLHWRADLSSRPQFDGSGEHPEIFCFMPAADGVLLADSSPPPSERFQPPLAPAGGAR